MKARRIYPSALILSPCIPVGLFENSRSGGGDAASDTGKCCLPSREERARTYGRTNTIPSDSYRLPDGTRLLTIYKTVGPCQLLCDRTVSYNDLSESARKGIDGYYEEQGLLYDTETELQKAYGDYLSCRQNGTVYQERRVRQEITPSAANETMP